MADSIDIVCVTDENYAPHCAALLKSIELNKGPEQIRVHAILDGVSDATLAAISAAVPGLEILSYPVTQHKALSLPPLLQISRATYLRLIIDEVIDPRFDRLLYLDIDMVVTGSLAELWAIDLAGRACGAVADPGVAPDGFARRFGLTGTGQYLNAGMLLIDMDRARQTGFLGAALQHLLDGDLPIEFGDQDALNLVLWQQWTHLDPTWNFQRKFLYDDFEYASKHRALPRIIHFTETAKPWSAEEWHPLAWLYWQNLRRTPFHGRVTLASGVGPLRQFKFWLKFMIQGRRASQRRAA